MKTIDLSEVSALAPLIGSASPEPVILTDNGQAVAAVVPTDERDVESLLLSINPQFQAVLERSKQRFEAEGGLSSDDVRKQFGLPSAETP